MSVFGDSVFRSIQLLAQVLYFFRCSYEFCGRCIDCIDVMGIFAKILVFHINFVEFLDDFVNAIS
jgi:hypothetical protein